MVNAHGGWGAVRWLPVSAPPCPRPSPALQDSEPGAGSAGSFQAPFVSPCEPQVRSGAAGEGCPASHGPSRHSLRESIKIDALERSQGPCSPGPGCRKWRKRKQRGEAGIPELPGDAQLGRAVTPRGTGDTGLLSTNDMGSPALGFSSRGEIRNRGWTQKRLCPGHDLTGIAGP